MTIRRIVPNLVSEDPDAGRNFYTEALGLEVGMDMGWIVTFVSKDAPTAQLTLVKPQPPAPHADYSVEVDDIEACHARVVAGGWDIVYALTIEPWGVRRFFVRDPNGKIANIMTHS